MVCAHGHKPELYSGNQGRLPVRAMGQRTWTYRQLAVDLYPALDVRDNGIPVAVQYAVELRAHVLI